MLFEQIVSCSSMDGRVILDGESINISDVKPTQKQIFSEPIRFAMPFTLKEPVFIDYKYMDNNPYENRQKRMRDKFHRKSRWK